MPNQLGMLLQIFQLQTLDFLFPFANLLSIQSKSEMKNISKSMKLQKKWLI